MGPRLFSRGNPLPKATAMDLEKLASMGPRLFSRGNGHWNFPSQGESSFNGAATLQPRKSRGKWVKCSRRNRFNGAATLQPRKLDANTELTHCISRLQWGRDSSAAEMTWSRPSALAASAIQWGRDSSAAETSKSGKNAGMSCGLQWGRDSSAAEIPNADYIGVRGKSGVSMGPRLFSRGNATPPGGEGGSIPLQWGRDSSAAEITGPLAKRF